MKNRDSLQATHYMVVLERIRAEKGVKKITENESLVIPDIDGLTRFLDYMNTHPDRSFVVREWRIEIYYKLVSVSAQGNLVGRYWLQRRISLADIKMLLFGR